MHCFVNIEISQTIALLAMLFGTIGKPSMNRGAPSWFHNFLIYDGKVVEYWTKFSLKIHLNWN